MGRRKKGRSDGGRQQIKGFRPGKEPPQLKKKRARARLGSDASWAQKQMVEAMAGQSPEALQKSLRRWSMGLLIAAILLGIGGLFLYGWNLLAGVAAHLVGGGLIFLWFRLRRQERQLMELAQALE